MRRVLFRKPVLRVVSGLLGLLLILQGISWIVRGNLNYQNYWGGIVFAPLAILVGGLFVYLVIFQWNRLGRTSSEQDREETFRKW